jgi:hypothetical protein
MSPSEPETVEAVVRRRFVWLVSCQCGRIGEYHDEGRAEAAARRHNEIMHPRPVSASGGAE